MWWCSCNENTGIDLIPWRELWCSGYAPICLSAEEAHITPLYASCPPKSYLCYYLVKMITPFLFKGLAGSRVLLLYVKSSSSSLGCEALPTGSVTPSCCSIFLIKDDFPYIYQIPSSHLVKSWKAFPKNPFRRAFLILYRGIRSCLALNILLSHWPKAT